MKTFLVVLVVVVAFVVGAALSMRPSPRERQLARLRQSAFEMGLRVQLRPAERSADYLLPWRLEELGDAPRLDAWREDSGEWSARVGEAEAPREVLAALALLPGVVRAAQSNADGVLARWEECGSGEEVAHLAAALRELREAHVRARFARAP